MGEKHKSLIDSINESVQKQIEETWKAGKPITTVKDGKVVHVYGDGKVEVINDLDKPYVKTNKIEYKL